MQVTHHTNGPNLPNFPKEGVSIQDVNVYIHDSGMLAIHDYSCPVCRENHAVLDLSVGIMNPCRRCEKNGYELIKKKKSWFERIFKRRVYF